MSAGKFSDVVLMTSELAVMAMMNGSCKDEAMNDQPTVSAAQDPGQLLTSLKKSITKASVAVPASTPVSLRHKRILAIIENAACGKLLEAWLPENASTEACELFLLHVTAPISFSDFAVSGLQALRSIRDHNQHVLDHECMLRELASALQRKYPGLRVTSRVDATALAASEILALARQRRADCILILLPMHVQNSFIAGGIATKVMRLADCAVQVIKS
jgi:hypothetical protein